MRGSGASLNGILTIINRELFGSALICSSGLNWKYTRKKTRHIPNHHKLIMDLQWFFSSRKYQGILSILCSGLFFALRMLYLVFSLPSFFFFFFRRTGIVFAQAYLRETCKRELQFEYASVIRYMIYCSVQHDWSWLRYFLTSVEVRKKIICFG